MIAWDEGGHARCGDLPLTSNPYRIDSNEYIDWEKGWAAHAPEKAILIDTIEVEDEKI